MSKKIDSCKIHFFFSQSVHVLLNIAFSKRKLCSGENFRIKDFDEFRCF